MPRIPLSAKVAFIIKSEMLLVLSSPCPKSHLPSISMRSKNFLTIPSYSLAMSKAYSGLLFLFSYKAFTFLPKSLALACKIGELADLLVDAETSSSSLALSITLFCMSPRPVPFLIASVKSTKYVAADLGVFILYLPPTTPLAKLPRDCPVFFLSLLYSF